jgi:hypothetical protein
MYDEFGEGGDHGIRANGKKPNDKVTIDPYLLQPYFEFGK